MRLCRPLLLRLALLLWLSLFLPSAFAGSITGVFQGTIVQLAAAKSQAPGKSAPRWIYVQGRNGAIRRANIAHATIEYDEAYPRGKRHKRAEDSLLRSATVRVTAEQDEAKDGEWQATHVLIVAPPGLEKPKDKAPAIVPVFARR